MDTLTGVASGLRYMVRWTTPRPTGSAAEATRGDLYLEIAQRSVWGDKSARSLYGINWSWVDLVEHLARHWTALVWEETDPLGLNETPSRLRVAANKRWNNLSKGAVEKEQRSLLRFERSHNLGMALGGTNAPALWVIREGANVVFTHEQIEDSAAQVRSPAVRFRTIRRPFPEVRDTLSALGDEIVRRLSLVRDERAALAVESWNRREQSPLAKIISIATGLSVEVISELQKDDSPDMVWEVDNDNARPTALLAAARMLGPSAPTRVIGEVLQWIRGCPKAPTPDLDALSSQATLLARELNGPRAFAQGYDVARWVREIPGVTNNAGKVDPEQLLASFGVPVHAQGLEWPGINAVACWSSNHGPAILINRSGKHAQGSAGRRATLAHELCHLLIDRRSSLPLTEVLGGRVPIHAEMRANAFAAELLLPRSVAGAAVAGAGDTTKEVNALKNRYGVSGEIVAWQSLRSDYALSGKALSSLREFVADPRAWDRATRSR